MPTPANPTIVNLYSVPSFGGASGRSWATWSFELPEGVVVRHHRKEWIEELTGSFAQLEFEPFEVTTMNGNKSAAFQYLGRAFPFPDTCV